MIRIKKEKWPLWNRLSEEEKKELIQADLESKDGKNLFSHDEVKEKHKKWLKK